MQPGDRVRLFRTYDPETKFIWDSLRDLIDEEGELIRTFTGKTENGIEWHGAFVQFDKLYSVMGVSANCLKGVDDVPTEMAN